MHISGLWEQAEVQGEKQPTHRQNMQTSHRKAAGGPQIQTFLPLHYSAAWLAIWNNYKHVPHESP